MQIRHQIQLPYLLIFILLQQRYQNGETDEVDEFCSTLSSQLDIFVNRMKSNSSRGRSIANDSSVQTLFLNITTMHTRLMQYIQQQESARGRSLIQKTARM